METSEILLKRRWIIPFAGFLLALMGGLAYSWGVFVVPLIERFGWSTAEAKAPFTVFMMTFALFMVPAGKLQDRLGPKPVAAIGSVLFLISYGLASLIGRFSSPMWLILTYGVIGGIACGFTYACVAPPARKWFPDRPGLAVSFAVMGFGLASVFFAPLKANFLIPSLGVEKSLFTMGITSFIVCLVASLMLKNPPSDFEFRNSKTIETNDVGVREVLKSGVFWMLWLTLFLVISGGLMSITLIPTYGKLVLGLSAGVSAVAISIFSAFNGFGRPLAGLLSDKFGPLKVMEITYAIQGITLLAFEPFVERLGLFTASALLGWGFAVTLALFPVITASYFGTKNLGMNYGMVFTAFGFGALASTFGGFVYDRFGSFTLALRTAGIMALVGLVLCALIDKKRE